MESKLKNSTHGADVLIRAIRVGAVDSKLSDKGYIIPGLGDTVSAFRVFFNQRAHDLLSVMSRVIDSSIRCDVVMLSYSILSYHIID